MPTSHPRTWSYVHLVAQSLEPRSVIDIGVGHGKTGVLLRESLDIAQRRYHKHQWTTRIYGIEVHADYRNPIWHYAYDDVIVGDALAGLGQVPDVDLILALDVWEHFQPEYARTLLDKCLAKSKYLLICTPIRPLAQGEVLRNPHEEHVSSWTPEDFRHVPNRRVISTGDDWLFVLSGGDPLPYVVWQLSSPQYQALHGLRVAWRLWRDRR